MNRASLLAAAALRTAEAAPALCAAKFPKASVASLGLVHSSTSDTRHLRRVSVELDQNRIRAMRLRKSIITGARLHDEEARKGSARGAWYMLTATYAEGSNASPRDVSELVKRIRGHFDRFNRRKGRGRARLRYLWVGELTKRLRPHYHLLIWIPRGYFMGKPDARGWWPHGMTKMERARNAVGYLAKYASKFCGAMAEAFPKGFRTHGVGGLNDESRRELRWWKAPKDARDALGPLADIRKALGGYVDKLTGEFWPSPWRVSFIKGRPVAWKLEPIA
ncbi:replication initiation protein [Pseudoxanthomonas sp. SGNA-20]|nr:replication initiation protein [Pseudoxanthomonas sp. SGNA-20]RRN55354.1 replication initiation protein [Pseudoxanthomonas sp. SGNA-20]